MVENLSLCVIDLPSTNHHPLQFHTSTSWQTSDNYTNKGLDESSNTAPPSNKHIIPADAITINKQLGVGEFGIVQQGVWTINGNERVIAWVTHPHIIQFIINT